MDRMSWSSRDEGVLAVWEGDRSYLLGPGSERRGSILPQDARRGFADHDRPSAAAGTAPVRLLYRIWLPRYVRTRDARAAGQA